MLYVIHGDQSERAREKVTQLRQAAGSAEVREVDGKKLDETNLIQALESQSLFGERVFVIIERFLTYANKRTKAFTATLVRIQEAAKENDIILYEEKPLDTSLVTKLTGAQVFGFTTPVTMFQFLDSLRPGNAKASLTLLTQTLQSEPAEIIYFLLVRRVRELLQLSGGHMPLGMQSWQASRLTSQVRHFTMKQLVDMHEHLLNIDISIKNGSTPFPLAQLLEQFIIQIS